MGSSKLVLCAFLLCLSVGVSVGLSGLQVKGNRLVNEAGQIVTLRGVDRSGTEFACSAGYGFFDGPTDQNSINVIKSWKVNAVRLPLNEDCWLGINGIKPEYGGQNYINAVSGFVNLFLQNNIYVIVDLHFTSAGGTMAKDQAPMPSKDHSIDFWRSAAAHWKGNNAIIFDLFNEPFPNGGTWDNAGAWACWKYGGGSCTGLNFQAAGMQDLLNAVRSTGANNVIMLGGLAWSNSFAQWLTYVPTDPARQTAASWHSYNFNYCSNSGCWNQYVLPVAQKYPVIIGEMGENDCNHGYIDSLMPWADSQGISYLGWTWNTWNCTSGPALISDYNGTPTGFGVGYKAHLARVASTNEI